MRILLLKPYAARTNELGLCQLVARPDTEIEYEDISQDFPITHLHHRYFRHAAISVVLERIQRAQATGYDAVSIACGNDPGLFEAREIVDIPVTATFESGGHIASMMGQRFSVLTATRDAVAQMDELASLYGFRDKLASIREMGIAGRDLRAAVTPAALVVERVNDIGRRCVAEDGAEVLLLTATLASVLFAEGSPGPETDDGVPVLHAMQCAVKLAEVMVDLRRLGGYRAVSRVGSYTRPPLSELRTLREFLNLPDYGAD